MALQMIPRPSMQPFRMEEDAATIADPAQSIPPLSSSLLALILSALQSYSTTTLKYSAM